MPAQITGQLAYVYGTPARVTFYRGQPIHVEGSGVRVDAKGSPQKNTMNFGMAAGFFLAAALVSAAVLLIGRLRKSRPAAPVTYPG